MYVRACVCKVKVLVHEYVTNTVLVFLTCVYVRMQNASFISWTFCMHKMYRRVVLSAKIQCKKS